MLTFGEEQLGRRGEFTGAVGEIYRFQIDRRPQMKDFFIEAGRGREVELALTGKPV
jgi:hypothetical protein